MVPKIHLYKGLYCQIHNFRNIVKDTAQKADILYLLPDIPLKPICPLPAKLLLYISRQCPSHHKLHPRQNHITLLHFSFYPSILFSSGKPHPSGVPCLLPYQQCPGQASASVFHSPVNHLSLYCSFHNIHLTFLGTVIVSPYNPILPRNMKKQKYVFPLIKVLYPVYLSYKIFHFQIQLQSRFPGQIYNCT